MSQMVDKESTLKVQTKIDITYNYSQYYRHQTNKCPIQQMDERLTPLKATEKKKLGKDHKPPIPQFLCLCPL